MHTIMGSVSGRVQGVGFRYFILQIAKEFQIKGYCKNTVDDRVIFVLQGDIADIEQALIEIERGPSGSFVDKMTKSRLMDSEVFNDFSIKR